MGRHQLGLGDVDRLLLGGHLVGRHQLGREQLGGHLVGRDELGDVGLVLTMEHRRARVSVHARDPRGLAVTAVLVTDRVVDSLTRGEVAAMSPLANAELARDR